MVVQTQSAKLGIATGKNLAEACRETYSRRTSIGMWIQAEIVAMSCDIAEVVGAALGLNLLFGIPLFPAALIAGAGAFAILALQQTGYRRLEAGIAVLVGVVLVSFGLEILYANPDGGQVVRHLFKPGFSGTESILLTTGIIGATVMPHVIYLHSALTQRRIVGRNSDERRRILRFEKIDVVIAMTLAGLVNLAMMIMAAALFHGSGFAGIDTIEGAFHGLEKAVSANAATIFGIALLASGFASSSVGTMSGQVVMQGFIHRRIPIFAAPRADPGAGPDRDRDRRQPDRRARDQPGRPLVRHPVRARPARAALPAPGPDGEAREPALADGPGRRPRVDHHRAQRVPAGAGVHSVEG